MYINEYGNSDNRKVILLAPMLISGQDIYELIKPFCRGTYCFIAPDQGGHGKAGSYVSAESEYKALKTYLLDKEYTEIALLYGASLGGAVAWKLFNDDDFTVRKVWLDGVALTERAVVAERFMKRMLHREKKKLDRRPGAVPANLRKLYGAEFASLMTENFERITHKDIDAICYACCHYRLKALSETKQRSLHLEYGSNDPDYKLSNKALASCLSFVKPVLRKGYTHCEYMAVHTKEYVSELECFMNNGMHFTRESDTICSD